MRQVVLCMFTHRCEEGADRHWGSKQSVGESSRFGVGKSWPTPLLPCLATHSLCRCFLHRDFATTLEQWLLLLGPVSSPGASLPYIPEWLTETSPGMQGFLSGEKTPLGLNKPGSLEGASPPPPPHGGFLLSPSHDASLLPIHWTPVRLPFLLKTTPVLSLPQHRACMAKLT